VNSQKAVDRILSHSTAKQEKLEDQEARAIFNSPPMLEAPPKDSDEIIEEMTRKMMMRLPKHPDMLSPEEREKLDADEKERLAREEIEQKIEQEIKESFDRIGIDYQGSNKDTPISWKTSFSKTAREYYKAQQRAQSEHEELDPARTTNATTDETRMEGKDIDPALTISNPAELPDDKQSQDEAKNGQSPFAHLTRKEFLDLIGINK